MGSTFTRAHTHNAHVVVVVVIVVVVVVVVVVGTHTRKHISLVTGEGVAQDYDEAVKWLTKAKAHAREEDGSGELERRCRICYSNVWIGRGRSIRSHNKIHSISDS